MSIIFTILVSILTLQPPVETPSIKGARISLVPKPQAVLNVTIENRRASPLIEWKMDVTLRGTSQPRMTQSGYRSLQPGERRTIPISLPNPEDAATATLTFVAFEDGFYEGTAQPVQIWQKAREEHAKDLSYWVRVLGMMPRVSEPDLRRYLADRAVERAGEVTGDPSGVRIKLRHVLQRYPSGPEVWDGLDRLRIEAQAALAAATRQPSGGSGGGVVDAVSSVAISAQEQAKATTYVAAIENLRGKAIEAVGFEDYDPATNRPRGGQSADFVVGDLQIHPKEIREMFFSAGANPGALPPVRLTFVLFDDLSFEGSMAARDEVLRHRETQADEYAHAIALAKQIATLPPEQVEAFLVAKRAERAKQLLSEGRRGETHMLEQFLREAKDAPERFVAGAKGRAESLERQRQRLLRHKTAAGAAKH
jgi:hypothetical protein